MQQRRTDQITAQTLLMYTDTHVKASAPADLRTDEVKRFTVRRVKETAEEEEANKHLWSVRITVVILAIKIVSIV